MDTATILAAIDQGVLTDLVRRELHSDTFVVAEWKHRILYGGISTTAGGIYLYAGTGFERGKARDWSLVLKIVRPGPGADNPNYFDYWKRELRVYQSSLLGGLPSTVRAPRCFGWGEQQDVAWLWLEEIVEEVRKPWPLEHHNVIARHLATFNGRYLGDESVSSYPWLTQGLLRSYLERWEPDIAQLRDLRDDPLVQRGWPDDQLEQVGRLWDERAAFVGSLDRLPRTVCHGDATPYNLFACRAPDGRDQTVAIDWAFVGIGALGEDLATLLRSQTREAATYEEIDRVIFAGYLEGLREAGWRGDPRIPRLGYAVAAALRYGLNALPVRGVIDPKARTRIEQAYGGPLEDFLDWQAQVLGQALALADEARQLRQALQI